MNLKAIIENVEGITYETICKMADTNKVQFREFVQETIKLSVESNISFNIISCGTIGYFINPKYTFDVKIELIKLLMEKIIDRNIIQKLNIISNRMLFNEKKEFVEFDKNINIHSLNKKEYVEKNYHLFKDKNVIFITDCIVVEAFFYFIFKEKIGN